MLLARPSDRDSLPTVILRKTGIFADKAGDFRRFPPRDRQTRSQRRSRTAKSRDFRAISRLLGSLAECTNALAGDAVEFDQYQEFC